MKSKLKQKLTETLRNTQKQVDELQKMKKDYSFQLSELERKQMESQLKWHQVEKRAKVHVLVPPPKPDIGPPMTPMENIGYILGVSVMVAGFLVWFFILAQFLDNSVSE